MERRSGIVGSVLTIAALMMAACGGKRSATEHLMLRWAEAMKFHLATDIAGGNEFPDRLADIDLLLRPGLSFEDAWGEPLRYRKINDGRYDLASAGPDGVFGNEDDLVVRNGLLYKATVIYAKRSPDRGFEIQREGLPR